MRNSVGGLVLAAAVGLASCGAGGSVSAPVTSETSTPTAEASTATSLVVVTAPTWFSTPTGNISCAVMADSARCDIVERVWQPPSRPVDCPLDWGSSLVATASGTASFACNSDTVYRPEVPMPYGRRVVSGSMSCDVVPEGVTCRSTEGHGFFLSRESYRIF